MNLTDILTATGGVLPSSLAVYTFNIVTALILGVLFSLAMQRKEVLSRSFALAIALLPPVVCVIFMMVNGSLGAGVAVVGAFSLVRFRSIPGSGREIMAVFISMAIGLTCGMGSLSYALVFTFLIIGGLILLEQMDFGEPSRKKTGRTLVITIPEDLNYNDVFEDLFVKYTRTHDLTMVKTTNMGSMFKLSYHVDLKDSAREKEFLDLLRVRNGNLEIACSQMATGSSEL